MTHYENTVLPHFAPRRKEMRRYLEKTEWSLDSIQALILDIAATSANPEDNFSAMGSLMLELVEHYQTISGDPYCYRKLIYATDLSKVLNYIYNLQINLPLDKTGLATACILYYHTITFERAGKQIYEVSPGLAQQLRDTELRGLYGNDLRLPYEAIYLTLPPSAGFRVYNNISGWHPLVGAYITEDSLVDRPNPDYNRTKQTAIADGKDLSTGGRGWRVLFLGADKRDGMFDWGDDALFYMRVPLYEERPLDEVLDDMSKELTNVNTQWGLKLTEMQEEWVRILKFIANTIIYATNVEPGDRWMLNKEAAALWERIQKLPKNSQKRSRLKDRFNVLSPQYRRTLGKHIIVNRHRNEQGDHAGSPREIRVATRVMGHWRRVVHGEKRMLRTWKHIAPYWRNPDGAPLPKQHKLV